MTKTIGSLIALVLTLSFTFTSRADITILPVALNPHLNLPSPTLPVAETEEPFAAVPPSSSSVLNVLDFVRGHERAG